MERLIESVRKYQCLWKTDIEEYKLNDVKEAAWREIVKECDLPDVKEAKTLWRKLRDGHRQAVNRKKTINGQAANTKKIWKYEKLMEFLLPSMQSRSRTTNINMQHENESSENEEHQTDDDMVPPKKENESSESEEHQTVNDIVPPKKKRNLISLYEQKRREIRSGERDSMRRQLSCNSNNVENTALGNFFMSMLQTTSDLPENLQLKVQRQLFNIVMEAKEEDIATRRHSIASSGSSSTV